MNLFSSSRDRELELLSAYLDNQLSPADRAKLERRLATDSKLRATLDDLQGVKTTLAALPKVKPPRNFTLTPKLLEAHGVAAPARPLTRLLPAVNLATALAAVLFAVLISADLRGGFTVATSAPQVENFQVAEAPAAESQAAGTLPAEAAPKLATETQEAGLSMLAPPDEAEPLTGESGGGGGGGVGPVVGGGGGPGASTGPVTGNGTYPNDVTASVGETATPVETAADSTAVESPTPDASLRSATVAETPRADSFATHEAPAQPSFPVRTAEIALGLTLILLIIASLFLRRR